MEQEIQVTCDSKTITFSSTLARIRGIDFTTTPPKSAPYCENIAIWKYLKTLMYANGDEDIVLPQESSNLAQLYLLCDYLHYDFGFKRCRVELINVPDDINSWENPLLAKISELHLKNNVALIDWIGVVVERMEKTPDFIKECGPLVQAACIKILLNEKKLQQALAKECEQTRQRTIKELDAKKKMFLERSRCAQDLLDIEQIYGRLLVQMDTVQYLKTSYVSGERVTEEQVKQAVDNYVILDNMFTDLCKV